MTTTPDWLPELILLEEYRGDWKRYEDFTYSMFYRDFIESKPFFQGLPVYIKRTIFKGKEFGFWHCMQEGPAEESRIPDLRRCERVGWIRAIIEHADLPIIKKWVNQRGRNTRVLLWFNEEYLVVLEKRSSHWLLCTAYCTTWERTKARLRRQHEQYLKS